MLAIVFAGLTLHHYRNLGGGKIIATTTRCSPAPPRTGEVDWTNCIVAEILFKLTFTNVTQTLSTSCLAYASGFLQLVKDLHESVVVESPRALQSSAEKKIALHPSHGRTFPRETRRESRVVVRGQDVHSPH